jgi:hypothetical protein
MLCEIWGLLDGTYCHSTLHTFDRQVQKILEEQAASTIMTLILKKEAAISPETMEHICQSTEHCNPYTEICKFLSYNMSCETVVHTAVSPFHCQQKQVTINYLLYACKSVVYTAISPFHCWHKQVTTNYLFMPAKEWYTQPSRLSTAGISKSLQITCFMPAKEWYTQPSRLSTANISKSLQITRFMPAKEWYIQPSRFSTADISKSLQITCFMPAKEWYIQLSRLSTADLCKSLQITCFMPAKADRNLTFQALCIFQKVTIWMFYL